MKNKVILNLISCLFILYKNANALYGISIDEIALTHLHGPLSNGIRISIFDMDKPSLKEVDYYLTFQRQTVLGVATIENRNVSSWNPIKCINFENGVISEVVLASNTDLENYLIISKFPIKKELDNIHNLCILEDISSTSSFKNGQFRGQENTYYIFKTKDSKKPHQNLQEASSEQPIFRLFNNTMYFAPATNLTSLGILNEGYEKGDIGEWYMDLYMIQRGYIKYSSKYGEEGFDGIYGSSDGSILILSDSKWVENGSINSLMKQAFGRYNDKIINRKAQMERKLIEDPEGFKWPLYFLQNAPNLYKAVCHISNNGQTINMLGEQFTRDSLNHSLIDNIPSNLKPYIEKLNLLKNRVPTQKNLAIFLTEIGRNHRILGPNEKISSDNIKKFRENDLPRKGLKIINILDFYQLG